MVCYPGFRNFSSQVGGFFRLVSRSFRDRSNFRAQFGADACIGCYCDPGRDGNAVVDSYFFSVYSGSIRAETQPSPAMASMVRFLGDEMRNLKLKGSEVNSKLGRSRRSENRSFVYTFPVQTGNPEKGAA